MKAEVASVQALQGEGISKAHAKNSKRDAGMYAITQSCEVPCWE